MGVAFFFTGNFGGGNFVQEADSPGNEQRGIDIGGFYLGAQQLRILQQLVGDF
ncbi:hypothetical protein D3C74_462670 [compost metagenome]